jgi:hypothetical protein
MPSGIRTRLQSRFSCAEVGTGVGTVRARMRILPTQPGLLFRQRLTPRIRQNVCAREVPVEFDDWDQDLCGRSRVWRSGLGEHHVGGAAAVCEEELIRNLETNRLASKVGLEDRNQGYPRAGPILRFLGIPPRGLLSVQHDPQTTRRTPHTSTSTGRHAAATGAQDAPPTTDVAAPHNTRDTSCSTRSSASGSA